MAWRTYLCDTMDGLLGAEIEVPSFSWTVSVSDCSFDSTADKGTGEGETSGITIPWAAVPGATPQERGAEVAAGRRGMVLGWDDGSEFKPIVWGAIGTRTDTALDTSFSLDSAMTILADRYYVYEGSFGADTVTSTSTTTDDDGNEVEETTVYEGCTTSYIYHSDMSFRAIASEVGQYVTSSKPDATLPIDWDYDGEDGEHERTYWGYNVANLSAAAIFEKLANVTGGPDIQFRPYMHDSQHVRLQFMAGSDDDVYLGQDEEHFISYYNDLTVTHNTPYSRVYQTGSGSETTMLCYLAEDTTYNDEYDVPLRETCASDTSDDSLAEVQSAAEANLAALMVPQCQMKLTTDIAQLPIGEAWPGESFVVPIYGFPSLPDGLYALRLMTMSGDESRMVTLTFDPIEDPSYA